MTRRAPRPLLGSSVVALLLLALAVGIAPAQEGDESEETPALDVGLTEQVHVFLRHVDFLALDKKGNPITDLRRSEVRVWDAGEEQQILDLLPVHERRDALSMLGTPVIPAGEAAPGDAPATEAEERPPVEEPPPAAPQGQRRWIIFYFDANNLSLQGRLRAGKAIRELVENELRPGDRVSLMVDEDELRIVVPFTGRTEELLVYLEDPQGLTSRARDIERRLRETQDSAEDCREAGYSDERAKCAMQAVSNFLFETSRETERGLEHLEALLRALGAIPDRKILFYVSEGFMLDPGDVAAAAAVHAVGQIGYNPSTMRSFLSRDFSHRIEKIFRLATDTRTGIYPVNTIRKMTDDTFAPEKRRDYGPDNLPQARTDPFETSWQQVTKMHRDMARATGGVPLFKQDPAGLLADQLRTSDGVYTFSYQPTRPGWDRRRIKIKIERKGVKVFFRDHYRHVPRDEQRLEGEVVLETSPEELAVGFVRARLKVVSGQFAVAPDSQPPASVACLFFELRDSANRVVQDLYEVIAFPRGAETEGGNLERPFAVRVPPGDYTLQVEVRDVHGSGWGSFLKNLSVGPDSAARVGPAGDATPEVGSGS